MKLRRPTKSDLGGRARRRQTLERIGGFWSWQIEDTSIGGRVRAIAILEEHDRTQRKIKMDAPEHYSRDFHIEINRALLAEREAFASMTRGIPADHPQLQLRLVK